MTKTIVPGYVETLDPFTVRLGGLDAEALPAERGGYAEVGMRGMVDVSGGRLWIGEYQSDGVPTEVRQSMSALSQAVEDVTGATNDNAEGFDRFTAQYSLDRTATAVELTDIRDSVAGIELSAVTTTRLAVISQDAGLYIDPTFSDADISAERATNTGMVYTAGSGLSGTSATVFLTGQGKDEGLTIPLIPQDRYTARVWGAGLTTANGRVLAIKHSNGVITDLPTVYGTGYMAATAVPTSAGARLLVRRISGTGSATITRVEVRHGIGGTLIDDNSIDADKINVDKAVVGLKLTSPNIETNPAAARGIKIINDRLTGYSPTGQLLIDIGGPTGLIKGVTLEGVNVNGGVFKTSAGTDGYVDIRSYGAVHVVRGIGTSGAEAFSLYGLTGSEELGILEMNSSSGGTIGRNVYLSPYQMAFSYFGDENLRIANDAIGPSIHAARKSLSITSDYGVKINGTFMGGKAEWVTLALKSGFTGSARYCIYGGVVYWDGTVSGSFTTTSKVVADVPAVAQPPVRLYGPATRYETVMGGYSLNTTLGFRTTTGTTDMLELGNITPYPAP